MADATSSEFAFQRLNSRGMKLQRLLIAKDGHEVDITEEALSESLTARNEVHFAHYAPDVEKAAIELNSEAQTDPISFDAARHLVAKQIRLGHPIPEALREWAADTIVGSNKRPKQKGKYRGATLRRDRLIAGLIGDIADMTNLKPTAGKRGEGTSACNAVAEGFSLLRLQPDSYESMLKIWRRRKELSEFNFHERV
ncbi:hypothetical protein [Roseovarius arcticus]|uniref:hypothetical protein n=1 Tax=Roseovarius arcticus TaxID=2547404 RepID=UPI0011101192|nr:hypothetical protein [Roseovarius arcticus]